MKKILLVLALLWLFGIGQWIFHDVVQWISRKPITQVHAVLAARDLQAGTVISASDVAPHPRGSPSTSCF
jgi:hypothetical protein